MCDFIKELPSQRSLNPTDITKVPAQIHFQKSGGFLYFNMLFQGLDVLAVRMRKSDEWFFGIYHGARYQGYVHFGDIPKAEHEKILEDIMPFDRNDLQIYVNRLSERIDYHESAAEAWRYIGELDSRKIIQRKT